jgi:hypothetical protein
MLHIFTVTIHKNKKMIKPVIILLILLISNCCREGKESKGQSDTKDSVPKTITSSKGPTSDFIFLGEKVGRKENFDTNIIVTKENIERLYSKYDVTKLTDSNYYKIESKKIYEGARYLTRLIKFVDNRQSKAINFYDYTIADIKSVKESFIIGLNSLSYSSTDYPSCFCCKIVIMNEELNKTFERKFQYADHEYTYLDTLYLTKDGFNVEIINVGFDSDDLFRYKATFDNDGKLLSSVKEKEIIRN